MEYFKIAKRFKRGNQDLYKISDLDGYDIKGTLYRYELQKINKSETDTYKIEKIIKRKKKWYKTCVGEMVGLAGQIQLLGSKNRCKGYITTI